VVEESHDYRDADSMVTWIYGLRDMVPDDDGEMITLQKGDSLHFDWTYLVDSVYNLDNLITTVWVQNDKDASIPGKQRNKILQSASAKVVDVAAVAGGGTPSRIWLSQNAPNPFTSETTIAYMLDREGTVRLSVYTPTGRLVTDLVDGYVEAGSHAATWDGLDRFGKGVGSGIYYYRLQTEYGSRSGRVVCLK